MSNLIKEQVFFGEKIDQSVKIKISLGGKLMECWEEKKEERKKLKVFLITYSEISEVGLSPT